MIGYFFEVKNRADMARPLRFEISNVGGKSYIQRCIERANKHFCKAKVNFNHRESDKLKVFVPSFIKELHFAKPFLDK